MAFMKMLWQTDNSDFHVKVLVSIHESAVKKFKVKVRVSIHNA